MAGRKRALELYDEQKVVAFANQIDRQAYIESKDESDFLTFCLSVALLVLTLYSNVDSCNLCSGHFYGSLRGFGQIALARQNVIIQHAQVQNHAS